MDGWMEAHSSKTIYVILPLLTFLDRSAILLRMRLSCSRRFCTATPSLRRPSTHRWLRARARALRPRGSCTPSRHPALPLDMAATRSRSRLID